MYEIPEKINRFNAYIDEISAEAKLEAVTDEVTLPDFQYMSESLSLSGMAGEVDSPAVGMLQSATLEIPFTNVSMRGFKLAARDDKMLILHAAQEVTNTETLSKRFIGRAIYVRGFTKSINYGRLKKGGYGNPSITKEVIYYKDVVEDEVVTEVDKFNGKFVMAGEDISAQIDQFL